MQNTSCVFPKHPLAETTLEDEGRTSKRRRSTKLVELSSQKVCICNDSGAAQTSCKLQSHSRLLRTGGTAQAKDGQAAATVTVTVLLALTQIFPLSVLLASL